MTRDPEEIGWWALEAINGIFKACALSPSGWAAASDIVKWTSPNMASRGGAVVGSTLTVLRGWKKPLVEARDGDYSKEYRLTPAGKRARKDARSSATTR